MCLLRTTLVKARASHAGTVGASSVKCLAAVPSGGKRLGISDHGDERPAWPVWPPLSSPFVGLDEFWRGLDGHEVVDQVRVQAAGLRDDRGEIGQDRREVASGPPGRPVLERGTQEVRHFRSGLGGGPG